MIARSQKNLRLKKSKKRKKAAMTSFVSYASFFVESKKKCVLLGNAPLKLVSNAIENFGTLNAFALVFQKFFLVARKMF